MKFKIVSIVHSYESVGTHSKSQCARVSRSQPDETEAAIGNAAVSLPVVPFVQIFSQAMVSFMGISKLLSLLCKKLASERFFLEILVAYKDFLCFFSQCILHCLMLQGA